MGNPQLAVLAVVVIIAFYPLNVEAEYCMKFWDDRTASEHNCRPGCLQPSGHRDPVYGTDHYSANSEICLAALHAGAIDKTGGPVRFTQDPSTHMNLEASDRNGVATQPRILQSWDATYYFPTSCKADEFQCDSGDCISNVKKCDGEYDCPDGDDELRDCRKTEGKAHESVDETTNEDNSNGHGIAEENSNSNRTPGRTADAGNDGTRNEDSSSGHGTGPSTNAQPEQVDSIPNTPQAPGKPIISHTSDDESMTLRWKLPVGSPEVDEFIISYRLLKHKMCPDSVPGEGMTEMKSGHASSYTARNLISFSTYQFCVTALNTAGVQGEQACDFYDTLNEDIEYVDFKAEELKSRSVLVKWEGAGHGPLNCPNNYKGELIPSGGTVMSTKETTGNSIAFENLSPETPYEIKFTINNEGPSKTLEFTTLRDPPMKPNVFLQSSDKHQLDFFWTLPAGSNQAHNFTVTYQRVKNKACSPSASGTLTTKTREFEYSATNLDSYSQYKVCVAAVNAGGQSPLACDNHDTLNEDVRDVQFTVEKVTQTTVLVTWESPFRPSNCPAIYNAELTYGGSQISTKATKENYVTFDGLFPDFPYGITFMLNGEREPSKSVAFTTLPNPPKKPTLIRGVTGKDFINLSWTLPGDSPAANNYIVSHKLLGYKACGSSENTAYKSLTTTSSRSIITSLESYSRYRMCVTGVNDGGLGPEACGNYETQPDVPRVTFFRQQCFEEYDYHSRPKPTTCTATVDGGCKAYNGPNFAVQLQLRSYLECSHSYHTPSLQEAGVNRWNQISANFGTLIPGQQYETTMTPKNDAGEGTPVMAYVTTRESKPPKVKDLIATAISSSEVRLLFNDPCPSNGRITHVVYSYNRMTSSKVISAVKCQSVITFDRCIDVVGLDAGETYYFYVAVRNSKGKGESSTVTAAPKETEPGPPSGNSLTRKDTSVTVHLHLPLQRGGKLHNCSIKLLDKDVSHSSVISDEGGSVDIELDHLEQGRRYAAEAFCCNSVGCGDVYNTNVTTNPAVPVLNYRLSVKHKSNTTITLNLPEPKVEGDGERYIGILVQHISEGNESALINNLTAEFIRLEEEYRNGSSQRSRPIVTREKREVEDVCPAPNDVYIAGIVYDKEAGWFDEFTVGSGTPSINCPLTPQEKYNIGVVAVVLLDGLKSYVEDKIPGFVIPKNESDDYFKVIAIIIGSLFIVLISLASLGFVYRSKLLTLRRRPAIRFNHDEGRNIYLRDNGRVEVAMIPYLNQVPTLPIHVQTPSVPQLPSVEENIYENISNDPIYTNVFKLIPRTDIEAYLCQSINSQEVSEAFSSVLPTAPKSMDYGARIENRKKNRYKNNLPYDETLVKLSIINDDPFSDYINANYVQGFSGALKYIATQGPKEENVNTIEDFWRMICEQKVTAIIMVANFVEGGKSKVGEYFRYDGALIAGQYTVKVVSIQEFPKYNISTIQICKGISVNHSVTHYHYKSWPDHGVPNEAYTLGSMLKAVIDSHHEGCIVVHCSAGIGRTGTVLLVLLLHDMLLTCNGIEPMQVLKRLRDCRAKLVDNILQYNLGLKVYEEIEFGALHSIQSNNLPLYTAQVREEIRGLHAKAKSFPINLKFSAASDYECISRNRNATVFPADSCRIYLPMIRCQSASQYINAVPIDGIHKSSSVIVTEHPLSTMVFSFWRLVVEKKCHSVVFINSFDGLEKEFPRLLPLEEMPITIGAYSLLMKVTGCYDSLILSTLKIVPAETKREHVVTVYQIISWPFGRELPPSPEVLLGVCDLILKTLPTDHDAGPTLLTCGDGVNGCGLMAAILSVIDQLKRYQEVNIYRTLVRLLRVRKEFFASPVQMEFLYEAAYHYVEMYKIY